MSSAYTHIEHELGASLKAARESASLSQKELAAELQVSERALQGWEAGSAFPQPRHRRLVLEFIAKYAKAAA